MVVYMMMVYVFQSICKSSASVFKVVEREAGCHDATGQLPALTLPARTHSCRPGLAPLFVQFTPLSTVSGKSGSYL